MPESVEIIGKSAFDDCYSLSHVLFKGSQEQYNWILFHSNNDYIKNAKWHLNATDTEITNEKFCNTMYAYCSICQKYLTEDGTVYPHQFYDYISDNNATCSEDGTKTAKCIYCEATDTQIDEHSMLEHTYDNNCDTACNVCKQNRTIKHNYSAATCTKPKTCKVCGTTSGKALGHKYNNACDTSCNVCKATRKITHKYTKKTTVKATVSKNGYILTECSVCGKDKSKTIIYYPKTIKLSASTYAYNSKVIKPTVTVKDSKNKTISSKYYTVTYQSGRKNVGKYKVTIKFKGNYSGSKVLYFTINPPKTTVSKLVAGKKSATVYITKKSAQVTGYQIQYATNKNFKSAKTKTISSYKTTKYALKGLSAKKYYYVRVRTYKKVSGITYYSGWSTLKYVKTK